MNWFELQVASFSRYTMPTVTEKIFDTLPDGRAVKAYMLSGGGGLQVEVLTLGGIVSRILAPDNKGELGDVALGFSTIEEYLREPHYFGAITGRVAGRIGGGAITVEGKTYQLALNNGSNHLHGGVVGLDRRLWFAEPFADNDCAGVVLRYRSPDGEEGYPGNVDFTVTYKVTNNNELLFSTEAKTDKTTPISLTNHTYFNLGGEGSGSIGEHWLQIQSDQVAVMDEKMTLQGKLESVEGQACDVRQSTRMADMIPDLFLNHGDTYRIKGDLVELVASVKHPPSGRTLTVRTTCPYLQFYTSMHFDGSRTGKSGGNYIKHAGFCLECEGYAEGVRYPELGDILVHPGQPQKHTTIYQLEVGG